ncbi:MAG TPA: hypothetical protein VHB50_10320 [Bryobacteraceae bacterium]|nr:hypothetical protein [Bryobacteraceae bacterium]
MRFLLVPLLLLQPLFAATPLTCPAGAPLGSFQVTVTPGSGGTPRPLQTVNQLLPGYKVSWSAVKINSPDQKKARVSLVLVPSDHGKVVILDPKPALDAIEWQVPVRTEIVSVVFGPQGLDKGKVSKLISKNDELIGELADYAQKTQQTQSLIEAIAQDQQSLNTGQNVNAAVVSFANQFPSASRLDRTQPVDQQLLTLVRGVNPALSAYDPLATNPSQRAAQSAGLAAAVAGLFFGTDVGLAASGGALLLNMHSLFFPGTEFRSAFAEAISSHKNQTALCGNKTPSASRTQLAFLWATRLPDTGPPDVSLPQTEHLPIGAKATFPIDVKARDWSLATRVQDWKLVSAADNKISVPAPAKLNTETKKMELDLSDAKLKPGVWKLAGDWDWTPLTATGEIDLHAFSTFDKARLAPTSQDRLTQSSDKTVVDLEGSDFEFVEKLSYKSADDKFAQPSPLPFALPKGPRKGPQTTLETQLEPKSLAAGKYLFLVAQSDGVVHEAPFKVLPAPPQIANLPLLVNTGADAVHVTLHGTGLDRIESLSADQAQIALGPGDKGDERDATVKLSPDVKSGTHLTLRMKVKDFEQPVALTDALEVAGPRPAITGVRTSLPAELDVALQPGEIPANSFVSFALDVSHADSVTGIDLSCGGQKNVSIRTGQSSGAARLRQETPASLFLSFDPQSLGQPNCDVVATIHTADNGSSAPKKLGRIVRLPKIESFELTDRKVGDNAFIGVLKGQDLDAIEKTGWDAGAGTPVQGIPAPVAGGGSGETLQVVAPWPAPAPHSPLYIWLRGEQTGRATTAKW